MRLEPRSLALIVPFLLPGVGCGEADYERSAATEASGDRAADTPDADAPVTETAWSELRWCSPRPVAYDVAAIPTLPTGVAFEGFCEGSAMDLPEGEPTTRFTLDREARVLEGLGVDHQVGSTFESTFTFDDAGRVRHVFITGTTGFYSSGVGTSWYDLNAEGEMTHKVAAEMPWIDAEEELWDVLVKEQRWDGDRLLSRTERAGQDGPLLREWSWRWDAQGRLVEAALDDLGDPEQPRRHEARWSYDASGAPSAVERWIDDVLVERQRWSFDGRGVLTSRTWEASAPAALAAAHGGEPSDWAVVAGLDDHQLRANPFLFDYGFEGNPWDDALPTDGVDGCAMLPRSAGHGYPGAEPEYWLGVAAGERPYDVGVAYGSGPRTTIRRYNDNAWYGHDGIGAGWLAGPGGAPLGEATPERVEVTVSYNERGQMTREDAVVHLGEGVEVVVERVREMDAEGRVASDEVKARSGQEGWVRELRFERDDAGSVVARELSTGERQLWRRDAEGRVQEHRLEAGGAPQALPSWAAVLGGDRAQPQAATAWSWRYDGERLVSRGGGLSERATVMSYDAEGRQVGVQELLGDEPQSGQTWAYDDAGRVVEACHSWSANAPNCTSTVYDHRGRVAWREVRVGEEPARVIELNHYTCR